MPPTATIAGPDRDAPVETGAERRHQPRRRRRRFDGLWVAAWAAIAATGPLVLLPDLGDPVSHGRLNDLRRVLAGAKVVSGGAIVQRELWWLCWAVVTVRMTLIMVAVTRKWGRILYRRLRWPATTVTVPEAVTSVYALADHLGAEAGYGTVIAAANTGRMLEDGSGFDGLDLRAATSVRVPAGIPRRRRSRHDGPPAAPEGLLEVEAWRWELLMGCSTLALPGSGLDRGELREVLRQVHTGLARPETYPPARNLPAWLRHDRALPIWVDLALRHVAGQYASVGRPLPPIRQVRADRWSVSVEFGEGGELLSGGWSAASSGEMSTWWALPRNPATAETLARTDLEDTPVPLLAPFTTIETAAPTFTNLAGHGPVALAGHSELAGLLAANLDCLPWLDQLAVIAVGDVLQDREVDCRVAHLAQVGGAWETLLAGWGAYRAAIVLAAHAPRGVNAAALPEKMALIVVGT